MYLIDISVTIYEGVKIIDNHYYKKKELNDDLILCLQSNDFKNNILTINENTKFIKQSNFQRYYSGNLSRLLLSYNDILYNKKYHNLYLIEQDFKYKILSTNEFLIIRPNSFLTNFVKDLNGNKYLTEKIKKIYNEEYSKKIELIEKIYIPKDFSEVEDILYIRPDKKRLTDLKKINIKQGLMTLDKVIKRIKYGEINVDTGKYFQRRDNLWSAEVKSRFIEALIVRQPVPAFYFDATEEDKWLIVDGLQRLSAIKEFVTDKTLRLTDLYYLSDEEFENNTFDEIPRYAQRNIEEYEIIAYKIESPTPKEVKLKIFRSINTSALILSNQEIRHALNHKINEDDKSSPSQYLEELSKASIFKTILKINNIKDSRMQDRELALRYLSFRIIPYQNYTPKMTEFLDDAMTKIYRISPDDLEKYKKDFGEALFTINEIYGVTAFRKSMFGIKSDEFINNYFETWTYIYSIITDKHREKLKRKKIIVKRETKKLIENHHFKNAIETKPAYTIKNVNIRFSVVKDFILKLVK